MFRLHREGTKVIPGALIVLGGLSALLFALNPWLGYAGALAGGVLAVLIVRFFRNPERQVLSQPEKILSVCDGKVVVIEEVDEPRYFRQPMRQISVFMSPLNVHVNRSPIEGEIIHTEYRPGKFLPAFHPKSSELNEHSFFVIRNSHIALAVKQIAGAMARRVKLYARPGDRCAQGAEIGFITFGSRIDILIPLACPVLVKLGETVQAGITPLARLDPHTLS